MKLRILLAALLTALAAQAQRPFVDTTVPDNLLELRAYAMAGGATVTQNYIKTFPSINDLNVTMGSAWGAGASATFAIRDFLALATELDLQVCNYTLDMAVTSADISSVSSIFLNNRYLTANIPVYMSVRFNTFENLKWNVDLGLFYSYGLWGRQWQSIYDSRVNALGQLVMQVQKNRTGYFNDPSTFINSHHRGDIGLYIGTGLTFGRHLFAGLSTQIGFKNVSKATGLQNPRIHNINLLARLGYKF